MIYVQFVIVTVFFFVANSSVDEDQLEIKKKMSDSVTIEIIVTKKNALKNGVQFADISAAVEKYFETRTIKRLSELHDIEILDTFDGKRFVRLGKIATIDVIFDGPQASKKKTERRPCQKRERRPAA